MKRLFLTQPFLSGAGHTWLRIITGVFLMIHGKEIFDAESMKEYTQWEVFSGTGGAFLAWLGKGSEFVSGVMLLLGLFTRIGGVIMIGTFSYITFVLHDGKVFGEDQFPFLFLLLGLFFLVQGPGKFSADQLLFGSGEEVLKK